MVRIPGTEVLYAFSVLCSRIRDNSGDLAVFEHFGPKSHDFGYAHREHLPVGATLNAYEVLG